MSKSCEPPYAGVKNRRFKGSGVGPAESWAGLPDGLELLAGHAQAPRLAEVVGHVRAVQRDAAYHHRRHAHAPHRVTGVIVAAAAAVVVVVGVAVGEGDGGRRRG